MSTNMFSGLHPRPYLACALQDQLLTLQSTGSLVQPSE